MREIRKLLTKVRRVRSLSVSALVHADECTLRAVSPCLDLSGFPLLLTGPYAERGTIAHHILAEIGARPPSAEHLEDLIDALLGRECNSAQERLENEGAGYARLRDCFTTLEWGNYRASIIRKAQRLLNVSRRTVDSATSDSVRGGRVFIEERFESTELGLIGRVDRAVLTPDKDLVISDWKTTSIQNEDALKKAFRQLELYALLMAESVAPRKVYLRVIADDGEREVEFTEVQRQSLKELVFHIRHTISKPTDDDVEALTTMGAHCGHCYLRPCCPNYRTHAPAKWIGGESREKLPPDTWGIVERIVDLGGNTGRLDIRDDVGRSVKIFGVTERLVPRDVEVGGRISLFNLGVVSASNIVRSASHPLNFYEIAPARGQKSAFNATSYRDKF